MNKWICKIAKVFLTALIICFVTLNLFEFVYRYYWIDFYAAELKALNPESDLNLEKDKTILIFGDSFSANAKSWVCVLRDSLSDYNVINSAVPGTSVLHQELFFHSRIEEFRPDEIIIQLYVGNDLIDYCRPTNWSQQSLLRNIYWSFSDTWISLQYLNYKMGSFKSNVRGSSPKLDDKFDKSNYNHRTINYLNADCNILQNSIDGAGERQIYMEELIFDLNNMMQEVYVPVSILLVPHCSQVNTCCFENMVALGANLNTTRISDFGFLDQLKKGIQGQAKIRILNALPTLKNNDNDLSRMYYQNDPHLNDLGQSVLGAFVLRNL